MNYEEHGELFPPAKTVCGLTKAAISLSHPNFIPASELQLVGEHSVSQRNWYTNSVPANRRLTKERRAAGRLFNVGRSAQMGFDWF